MECEIGVRVAFYFILYIFGADKDVSKGFETC